MQKFEIGDVVHLKSGSPYFVVTSVREYEGVDTVTFCWWCEIQRKIEVSSAGAYALEKRK